MVLPAPPAHATPAEPHWFDKVVVAIDLSAHGVLTLVDHAAPSRLREAYLRLRVRDPATDLIVDVQRLAELPPGITVILAVTPSISSDALDWLNLNRPLVADRRLNIVLWCEDDAAAVLARGAPDFFDWISARVDCPPAPAAFAVADVKAAIRARAPGIAWAGPGLEETLTTVRPGRPIRRVAVASYQSMIDALTSREPGWLLLDGIDTEFHLRRLRWAMAETGRRVIVFRRASDYTLPGWWTVHAQHVPTANAVQEITGANGTSRLAALTGLDPSVIATVVSLLHAQVDVARLEDLLARALDLNTAQEDLARSSEWLSVFTERSTGMPSTACQALDAELEGHRGEDDPVVLALLAQPLDPELWTNLGASALDDGDPEVGTRWLTTALQSLPNDPSPAALATALTLRGVARLRSRDVVSARVDLERAHATARSASDTSLIAATATGLASLFLEQGEPRRAREFLETSLNASTKLEDETVAKLLDMLAWSAGADHDLTAARSYAEQALLIKQRMFPNEDDPSIATSLGALGGVMAAQGDLKGAQPLLERSLKMSETLLGREHPNVRATLRALAQLHYDSGDLVGARAYLDRVATVSRDTFGREHPETAVTFVLLGRVLAASGEMDSALEALERALAIQQKVFGGDGQLAGAETRRELAKVRVAKGDLTGAIENLQQALATLRRIHERDDQPDVAATLRELERLQALQRDVQRAD
jgi:tetratricopeptide (TPR) repeat protein